MSRFYVGQRVRTVVDGTGVDGTTVPAGAVGTIVGKGDGALHLEALLPMDWMVAFDDYPATRQGDGYWVNEPNIEPLDDFDVRSWWDENVMKPIKQGQPA